MDSIVQHPEHALLREMREQGVRVNFKTIPLRHSKGCKKKKHDRIKLQLTGNNEDLQQEFQDQTMATEHKMEWQMQQATTDIEQCRIQLDEIYRRFGEACRT